MTDGASEDDITLDSLIELTENNDNWVGRAGLKKKQEVDKDTGYMTADEVFCRLLYCLVETNMEKMIKFHAKAYNQHHRPQQPGL